MKKTILIVLLFASLLSCRTAKKEWVKENFASNSELLRVKDSFSEEISNQEDSLIETMNSKYNEILEQKSSHESDSETEDSTITGTIIAEEGKEKSVSYGGTTINSNGATIQFTTKISKAISKEYSSKFQELNSQLDQERQSIRVLETELTFLKKELETLQTQQINNREAKTRDVKSNGFQVGTWIWLLVVVVVIVLINIFKNQIPFISNILK